MVYLCKLNIFEKILSKKKADVLTNTFLKVISSNKRFAKLSSIISQFININSQRRGDILADVKIGRASCRERV